MDEAEKKEFMEFIRKRSLNKMKRLEKKLKRYARIYYGEPVAILYARNGVKVVYKNGEEGVVRVSED